MKKKITNSVILPSPSPTACVYLYIHLYTSICIFIYRGEKNINPKLDLQGRGRTEVTTPGCYFLMLLQQSVHLLLKEKQRDSQRLKSLTTSAAPWERTGMETDF